MSFSSNEDEVNLMQGGAEIKISKESLIVVWNRELVTLQPLSYIIYSTFCHHV